MANSVPLPLPLDPWVLPSVWEWIGFISGVICVVLIVRRNIANFSVGIISCLAFFILFLRDRLFGDAGLQIVFIVLSIHGWIAWHRKRTGDTVAVRRISRKEAAILAVVVIILSITLKFFLDAVKGSAPILDAVTTSLSLVAQWMLNRRFVENWLVWMLADGIYVYLYIDRALYLTAVLYTIYFVLCIIGWFQWRAQTTSPVR